MQNEINIGQIAQQNLLSCPPATPLREAARRMTEARCSSMLVVDGAKVVGIWTEQDALALDLSDPGIFDAPIEGVMSSPVRAIYAKTSIGEAALLFREENLRHFLVTGEDGENLGIVTQTDVVLNQGIEYFISLREVKSVLNQRQLVVPDATPLHEAVASMRAGRFDALITEGVDGAWGIITERDVVRLIGSDNQFTTIGELARRPLICVGASASLYHARKLFTDNRVRHLGVTGQEGELLGLITFSDILESIEYDYVRSLREELRQRDERLAVSDQSLRMAEKVFENSFEGIMFANANIIIESVNPAFTQITGYKAHEVIGRTPKMLNSGKHDPAYYREMWASLNNLGRWQGEIWNRRKNGEIYPEWLSINVVKNAQGAVTNYIAIFSDITERKAAEDRVWHLAHHDVLTGLPNRMLLVERLGHALAHAHRNQRMVAVIFLDLDRFKVINDTFGHSLGDQLLQVVAQRLVACVREDDTVARLGGDEFTVILEDIGDTRGIAGVAQKIIDTLSQPTPLDGHEVSITTSIGISVYPGDDDQAESLIKHADAAMYLAKSKGRNNFQFFTAESDTCSIERLTLENRLRKALENDELVLHYQPQVDITSHRISGMEALLRWNHPHLGLLQPGQFIPMAEETGLIIPIGEWVLREACSQAKAWRDEGMPALRVAVNISGRQFNHMKMVETVRSTLDATGLPADCLELEITESIAMAHVEDSIRKLLELRAMGVRISMDDFGTGHSSLSYLTRFPLDTLKIDKSFVQNLEANSSDSVIATAIVTMAQSLNLNVITEGVETEEQLNFLKGLHRNEVQGFYFSHPLPADAFALLLRANLPLNGNKA